MNVPMPSPGPSHWHPAVDPVCGRVVAPVPIAYDAYYGGDQYYFCSVACLSHFSADPASYLAARADVPVG